MPASSSFSTSGLIKRDLADRLRAEIMSGRLPSGQRIIEASWSARFGVAQASIREAINLLAMEGFVTKQSGRSARVLHFSEQDIAHLYQLRGAVEGLAARLAAQAGSDTSELQLAVNGMRAGAVAGQRDALLDCDLRFHLRLCELSANPFLIEQGRRILLPFFAFVRMRIAATQQETAHWSKDLEAHQRVIDLIRDGEGEAAELYLKNAMSRFALSAYDVWERRVEQGIIKQRSKDKGNR